MSRPSNLRQQRFSAEMKRVLSDIVKEAAEEIPELANILIEVSDVRVTPDLQQVRAYILAVPAEKLEFVVRLLNQYQKPIRHRLSQRIRHHVRIMPSVQFFVDQVELSARRVEEILRKLPPPGKE
ncbi:MAG: ribosome-binding factor A [Bacteroidia bacterium]|nr:ribosome-binding factor A [Bacteroidia bacterium]MDW8235714.1 ribosome-binding factor A [Bacteroidia bacterium]